MTEKPQTQQMFSAQEIADYMGVHKKTVLNWIEAKKIPAFKFEKTYRVPREAFEEFVQANMTR